MPAVAVLATLVLVPALAGCGTAPATAPGGRIEVVAAESQYGDVAAQIGGTRVKVVSIESNPNIDPHAYELIPSVAREVSGAALVVQNGLGYDPFMSRIEAAAPSSRRQVIDVQKLLGLPGSTPNPHLWYDPSTMPAVAGAVAADLGRVDPSHASTYQANLVRFEASLRPWLQAVASFRSRHAGAPAATTEPVADYLLEAMGIDDRTPWAFQADVMNGTDPTPQAVAHQSTLLSQHRVSLLAYNAQVTDPVTASLRDDARRAGVPVVAVYEIMPSPGYHYQSWMLAETDAIEAAVTRGVSTVKL